MPTFPQKFSVLILAILLSLSLSLFQFGANVCALSNYDYLERQLGQPPPDLTEPQLSRMRDLLNSDRFVNLPEYQTKVLRKPAQAAPLSAAIQNSIHNAQKLQAEITQIAGSSQVALAQRWQSNLTLLIQDYQNLLAQNTSNTPNGWEIIRRETQWTPPDEPNSTLGGTAGFALAGTAVLETPPDEPNSTANSNGWEIIRGETQWTPPDEPNSTANSNEWEIIRRETQWTPPDKSNSTLGGTAGFALAGTAVLETIDTIGNIIADPVGSLTDFATNLSQNPADTLGELALNTAKTALSVPIGLATGVVGLTGSALGELPVVGTPLKAIGKTAENLAESLSNLEPATLPPAPANFNARAEGELQAALHSAPVEAVTNPSGLTISPQLASFVGAGLGFLATKDQSAGTQAVTSLVSGGALAQLSQDGLNPDNLLQTGLQAAAGAAVGTAANKLIGSDGLKGALAGGLGVLTGESLARHLTSSNPPSPQRSLSNDNPVSCQLSARTNFQPLAATELDPALEDYFNNRKTPLKQTLDAYANSEENLYQSEEKSYISHQILNKGCSDNACQQAEVQKLKSENQTLSASQRALESQLACLEKITADLRAGLANYQTNPHAQAERVTLFQFLQENIQTTIADLKTDLNRAKAIIAENQAAISKL